eukprot:355346-Chlamydomonas_euryale.AAC.1
MLWGKAQNRDGRQALQAPTSFPYFHTCIPAEALIAGAAPAALVHAKAFVGLIAKAAGEAFQSAATSVDRVGVLSPCGGTGKSDLSYNQIQTG